MWPFKKKCEEQQTLSQKGVDLIAEFEGYEKKAYNDVAGYKTIGYGHLLTRDELMSGKLEIDGESFQWRKGLTKTLAKKLLDQDADIAEKAVRDFVKVKLTQEQFDSLVSFVFNVGVGAFKKSTLLRVLNGEYYNEVPNQFMRWVYAGGKKVKGLANRRTKEAEAFRG